MSENKENIVAARQAIEQIFSGLEIKTVVYVDDVYSIQDDAGVELVIEWFSNALSKGKTQECNALVGKTWFSDDRDDEIWKRRLREHWSNINTDARANMLDRLAAILGIEVETERDRKRVSLLQSLIPCKTLELSPSEWEERSKEIIQQAAAGNGVLCLFDYNLQGAHGYTDQHGVAFLKGAINARGERPVICGLLTHTVQEGDEIDRSSQLADEYGLNRSDFLILSKDRLNDSMHFAHGLKMMSLNYARDSLARSVREIAQEADRQANEDLMQVSVYNFDYMVLRSSEKEGVWEVETLFRLFEILRRIAFQKQAFSPNNIATFNTQIARIRVIREVKTDVEPDYPPNQRWKIRKSELYDEGEFINSAHLPLEPGDIFAIGDTKFILVAQPCDLVIRRNGKRAAETVVLLKVTTPSDPPSAVSSFTLNYFALDAGTRRAYAKFRSAYSISASVL
ncbi:MAG: hypothetical protein DRI48_07470, partial [Chloroflexi bacterium]